MSTQNAMPFTNERISYFRFDVKLASCDRIRRVVYSPLCGTPSSQQIEMKRSNSPTRREFRAISVGQFRGSALIFVVVCSIRQHTKRATRQHVYNIGVILQERLRLFEILSYQYYWIHQTGSDNSIQLSYPYLVQQLRYLNSKILTVHKHNVIFGHFFVFSEKLIFGAQSFTMMTFNWRPWVS